MKYISIDIETTGLSHISCQVVEMTAIIDDLNKRDVPIEQLPTFNKVVYHDNYYFEKIAMQMHQKSGLLDLLINQNAENGIHADSLFVAFNSFITQHWGIKKVIPAGKNFGGFDNLFLKHYGFKFAHRAMDPTAHYIQLTDEVPPDLAECLKRAQLEPISVAHRSLGDAQAIVRLMRHGYSHLG